MKKRDLFRLHKGLVDVSYLSGVKFAYTVVKNKKLIETEIQLLQDIIKPTDDFQRYERERIELCENFCVRGDDGQPIVENNNYKIDDKAGFDEAMDILKDKYETEIVNRAKQVDDYNRLLGEDVDINLIKLKVTDLPEGMSADQIESVLEIVE